MYFPSFPDAPTTQILMPRVRLLASSPTDSTQGGCHELPSHQDAGYLPIPGTMTCRPPLAPRPCESEQLLGGDASASKLGGRAANTRPNIGALTGPRRARAGPALDISPAAMAPRC